MTHDNEVSRTVPKFYTVPEAARVLRVDPATIYRAIRAKEFPAVRLRSRYVVPARAVERLAEEAAESLACVDVAQLADKPRAESLDQLALPAGCPCGAATEPGQQVCRKCNARDRWARRRSQPSER